MPQRDRTTQEPLLSCGGGSTLRSQIRHRLRRGGGYDVASALRRASADAVFDCAFAPPTPSGTRYLLGCSSSRGVGALCIWDVDASAGDAAALCSSTRGLLPHQEERDGKEEGRKRRKRADPTRGDPVLRVEVVDERGTLSSGSLYRIEFFGGDGSCIETSMLAACGDGGVFLYRWFDILAELEMNRNNRRSADSSSATRSIRPLPASILRPHPSPSGLAEINGIDYDPTSGMLYGASGDMFGGPCVWDVETGTLLGNIGSTLLPKTSNGAGVAAGRKRNAAISKRGHSDFLHAVKVVSPTTGGVSANTVLTGGEDGKLGVWDGKERRLIELVDVHSALEVCPPGSIPFDSGRGGAAPPKQLSNGGVGGFWVSSVDLSTSSSWAAVGGGVKSAGSGKRSGSSGGARCCDSGGYVSLFSLPSRTPTSAYLTRETVHDLTYRPGLEDGSLLTVGNEPVLSRWNGADLSGGRVGRTWTGCAAGFSVVVDPFFEEGEGSASLGMARVAVSGAGGSVDVFSHVGNRSFGLTFR